MSNVRRFSVHIRAIRPAEVKAAAALHCRNIHEHFQAKVAEEPH
jgi:hypothetical protein